MQGFFDKFGGAFTPEAVKILADAFDEAWARLKANGSPYAGSDYAEAARTHLAKSIINSARRGEWNHGILVDDALFYIACQKLTRIAKEAKRA
jgi:hypothetical protein